MAFESISEYINSLDENGKKSVTEFISFMNKEFPEITPKISFSMPMWWAGPKMYDGYVAISPAKKHFSIHFHEENYLLKLRKELPGCNFGKKCVNIRYDDEQSFQIVRQNVKEYFHSIL